MKDIRGFVLILLSLLIAANPTQAQWLQSNGANTSAVQSFVVSGTNLFAGTADGSFATTGGVFLSVNNGTSWTAVDSGLANNRVDALAVSGTNLFAGTPNGVFLSTNNGTNWVDLNVGFSNIDVRALALSGTNLFAGTYGGGIYRSTDNGANWNAVKNGLTSSVVIALVVSGANLFAGTYSDGSYRSTDNGASWTAADSGLTGHHVPVLAVSGVSLFAGTNDGVFLSTNDGSRWTAIGLQDTLVSALVIGGTNVFVGTSDLLGTSGSVILSTNNGTSWTTVNSGLPNTAILSLAVSGNNLVAGTGSAGIWTRPLSQMTAVDVRSNELPSHFKLEQNYPNPFNPSTTIRYSLPDRSTVRLVVTNTLGQEIAVLNDADEAAGYHEIEWKANVASGLYFYRIEAISTADPSKRFVQVRKMLMLK